MTHQAVDELLQTVRWYAPRTPRDWPAIESAVGVRYPSDFREIVDAFPPGTFQDGLSILHPARYESLDSYAKDVVGYADLLRLDAAEVNLPYPLFPEAGGLLPWGLVGFDFVLCWLTGDEDPDRWPIVVCESHLSSWSLYELGTAEFLKAVTVLPSPITPLAYLAEGIQPPNFASPDGESAPAPGEPSSAYWRDGEALRPLVEPVDAVAELSAYVTAVPVGPADWGAVMGRLGLKPAADFCHLVDRLGPVSVGPATVSAPDGSADDFIKQFDKLRRRIVRERATGTGPLGTIWPEKRGLLRWGSLAGGGFLCWIPTTAKPSEWPVIALDATLRMSVTYAMSASRFLLELATHPERIMLPPAG